MKVWGIAVVAAAGLLVACGGRPGGFQDALRYDSKSLAQVEMPDDVYRVFEHPSRDRIMTTSSLGKAAGQGAVRGLTFGAADVFTPEQMHEAAARRYLDITGRNVCTIKSGYELVTTQYEFMIDCPAGTIATPAPSIAEQT